MLSVGREPPDICVNLAFLPLGLGPPSLHQGMAPAFPPGLGGSLPSAYQFVRDPQSGQLVVIPSDHLPHFGKWPLSHSQGLFLATHGDGTALCMGWGQGRPGKPGPQLCPEGQILGIP